MTILFVRHGQASAGTDDYDRLSPRGVEQSRRLGQWLVQHGRRFDRVLVGGMQRHAQTEAAVREGYLAAGLGLPEPETEPGLAEFDHHAVFDTFARTHADHPSVAAAREGGLQSFGAMIHHALTAWSQDRLPDVPETWNEFGARARETLGRLQDAKGDVLVLSSGGIISRITQAVIGIDDRAAIDLNLSLRNAGLCEFNRRPYGLAMSSWNALPHLHDARELWTYF